MRRIAIVIILGLLMFSLPACSLIRTDRPTEQPISAATTVPFTVSLDAGLPEPGQTYEEYVTVQDDAKAIQMSVPAAWSQVDGSSWELDNKVIGTSISAASDLEAFRKSFSEPGVYFGVSNDMVKLASYSDMLELYRKNFSTDCTFNTRNPYANNIYQGAYDTYTNCSGAGNTMLLLSAQLSQDMGAYVLVLLVNLRSKADAIALDKILSTMEVVGELP